MQETLKRSAAALRDAEIPFALAGGLAVCARADERVAVRQGLLRTRPGAGHRDRLGRVGQCGDLSLDGELLQRRGFDLPYPLTCEAERSPDCFQGRRIAVAVQAVAELYDLALAFGKLCHRVSQDLLLEADGHLLLGLS